MDIKANMNTNIFGLSKRTKTNININICTGIHKYEYKYEYSSHTVMS